MTSSSRKPDIDEFSEALRKTGGNLSAVAGVFGVTRQTVYNWMNSDEEFKGALKDARMKFFDQCLDAGRIVALGIPQFDQNGQVVGWKERPDGQMLRYFISTLGREEGFGDSQQINLSGSLPTVINIVRDSEDPIR